MIIYLSLLLTSFILSIVQVFTKERRKKYFKYIEDMYIFYIFILFVFNRNNNDYKLYTLIFNNLSYVQEKGYLLLNYLIKSVGGTYNINLLILGCLMIYVLFRLYNLQYRIFFIFLYSICLFIYDINQVRNLYSILFVLIGLKFLSQKKDFYFILFVILAISFQRLALIYLIFYILSKFKFENYIKVIIFLLFIILLFIMNIQNILISVFPDKILYYLKNSPNYGYLSYYIYFLIDIFLLIYTRRQLNIKSIYFKFILFPIIMLPTSCLFLELIGRLWRNMFYVKCFYLFPCLKNKRKRPVIFVTLIVQQVLFIGLGFIKNPEFVLNLLSQISNIQFYF